MNVVRERREQRADQDDRQRAAAGTCGCTWTGSAHSSRTFTFRQELFDILGPERVYCGQEARHILEARRPGLGSLPLRFLVSASSQLKCGQTGQSSRSWGKAPSTHRTVLKGQWHETTSFADLLSVRRGFGVRSWRGALRHVLAGLRCGGVHTGSTHQQSLLSPPRRQDTVYLSADEQERFELTTLGQGPDILGVQTTTRRDRAYEGGLLVEDTFDYFAQDVAGNVWYWGEDVTNYIYDDEGNLIDSNNASTWRAGENYADPGGDPAEPGFIMPTMADALTDGSSYYQEFAADDGALDQARHFLPLVDIVLDFGEFTDVLRVLETTELEPDAREFKYYAPDVGLILVEEGLDTNLENPELTFELVAEVPEPPTLALLSLGLLGVFMSSYWRRPKGKD